MRLALEDADAVRVLTWAEQWRAATLRLRPARPPDDAALTEALIDLRRVSAELEAALLEGRPVARLRHEQAAIEAGIRAASRRSHGQRSDPSMSPSGFDELGERLGDRALVALVDVDATLWAVVVADGRARLHEVGSSGRAADELESVHFALRRLASRHGSAASLRRADRSARDAAARLDAQLLGPLEPQLQGREVVLVPPAVAARNAHLAVADAAWPTHLGGPVGDRLGARGATSPADMAGRAVLAAGPRLSAADEEVAGLAARHPHATRAHRS